MTRSKIVKIIIGVCLIVLGGLWLFEAFGIIDFHFELFFDGWWAVLCMVIFIISMVSDGPNFGNILCFCIFFILFLNARDLIPKQIDLWLLLFAVIVLVIGGKLILGAFRKSGVQVTPQNRSAAKEESGAKTTYATDDINRIHSKYFFTGETVRFDGVTIGKLSFEVNFSGVTLNFSSAHFTEESHISVSTNFGETKIILPADACAQVTEDATFGSVKNAATGTATTVPMKLEATFGAISVRNA